MSGDVILCLILLGSYSGASLLLSVFVALLWHVGLKRTVRRAQAILALRLAPAAGALLATIAVALPAFLEQEPARVGESTGPLIWGLASLALLMAGDALRRGWQASKATQHLKKFYHVHERIEIQGHQIGIVEDIAKPVVAVFGARRPQIIAAKCVVAACSALEFRQIVAHEIAHSVARDNYKLVGLLLSPDVLAWLPLHSVMIDRWRMAAEFEADQHAAGSNPRNRLALASALIKVARLGVGSSLEPRAFSMPIASDHDNIEERVRTLLLPLTDTKRTAFGGWLAVSALLSPLIAVPFYATVQRFVETVLAFGR